MASSLAVIGKIEKGRFIPKQPGGNRPLAGNDVVISDGVISRLVEDGRTGRLQLWGMPPGVDLGMPDISTAGRVVGCWVDGEFIPSDDVTQRAAVANDVVESGGEFYRVVDCGTRFQLWKVTADVATSLFFSQVSPLAMVVEQ